MLLVCLRFIHLYFPGGKRRCQQKQEDGNQRCVFVNISQMFFGMFFFPLFEAMDLGSLLPRRRCRVGGKYPEGENLWGATKKQPTFQKMAYCKNRGGPFRRDANQNGDMPIIGGRSGCFSGIFSLLRHASPQFLWLQSGRSSFCQSIANPLKLSLDLL